MVNNLRDELGRFVKGHPFGKRFQVGQKAHLGIKHSEETKRKISESKKGQQPTNPIKKGEHRGLATEFKKGMKFSEEQLKQILRRREKSSLELKFEKICQTHNLPYKFVGNGQFFIERKNPDFINVNGEKIAIEVYYPKHKLSIGQAKGIGIERWKQERSDLFAKYGWEIKFFDVAQVTEENILKELKG